MVNVIGVRFQNAGKLYFFDPSELWPTPGDFVVVETARGIEFGEVVTAVQEMNDEQLTAPLKKVVRIASVQDVQHAQDNKTAEKEAYTICQRKISEHKLDMKLVSVEYTFDNSKILFYFTANGRVDFRSLVKDLASVFKTRIELRQIGVRDEAKMLGGLGPCGRPICCGTFLGDFQPVSIKMAKEQNLSLNPIKISGVCGRLMCCLKYEQDNYEATRKRMPRVGREVLTPDGYGTVCDLNIIKETVRVRIQKGDSSEMKDYPLDDIQRPGQMNRKPADREDADEVNELPVQADAPEMSENDEAAEQITEELPAAEMVDELPDEAAPAADEQSQPKPHGERKGDRNRNRNRGDRPERSDRSERPEREQHADGEQRQRPPRKERPAKPNGPKPQPAAAPAQKAEAAPAPKPEAKPEQPKPEAKPEQPKAEQSAKPAANAWKQQLERAMRAARGDQDEAPKAE